MWKPPWSWPQSRLTPDEKEYILELVDALEEEAEDDDMDLFWHNYGVDQAMQNFACREYDCDRRDYTLDVAYRLVSIRKLKNRLKD